MKNEKKIVIFASGSGTNAENIINYFKDDSSVNVSAVFCNNSKAKVLQRAEKHHVETFLFNKTELYDGNKVIKKLKEINPNLIVLAGFLLKIPANIIEAFENKIINIHPALLPKYGGKGMYGMHIHQAVIEHKESETGISIHYVNQHYDDGAIIFQATCKIDANDTANHVADKIHKLEMEHFPKVIKALISIN